VAELQGGWALSKTRQHGKVAALQGAWALRFSGEAAKHQSAT
jgi:hypothetical protein